MAENKYENENGYAYENYALVTIRERASDATHMLVLVPCSFSSSSFSYSFSYFVCFKDFHSARGFVILGRADVKGGLAENETIEQSSPRRRNRQSAFPVAKGTRFFMPSTEE